MAWYGSSAADDWDLVDLELPVGAWTDARRETAAELCQRKRVELTLKPEPNKLT